MGIDKQARKAALRKVKETQRTLLESQMPISKSDLQALFDYLDRALGVEGCDHTLKRTSAFLDERHLPKALVLDWAATHGGYCDCEVLANVESEYDGILNRP